MRSWRDFENFFLALAIGCSLFCVACLIAPDTAALDRALGIALGLMLVAGCLRLRYWARRIAGDSAASSPLGLRDALAQIATRRRGHPGAELPPGEHRSQRWYLAAAASAAIVALVVESTMSSTALSIGSRTIVAVLIGGTFGITCYALQL